MVSIGDCSGTQVDKFQKFGLTALPAAEVKAPLISECLACLECHVTDYLDPQGIFILQGVRAWTNQEREERRTIHANGDGTFVVDGKHHQSRSLMEDKLPLRCLIFRTMDRQVCRESRIRKEHQIYFVEIPFSADRKKSCTNFIKGYICSNRFFPERQQLQKHKTCLGGPGMMGTTREMQC